MSFSLDEKLHTATAISHPNIAFIKYWGNRDAALRIPVNGSISMNLDGLETTTRVTFDPDLQSDSLMLNSVPADESACRRVSAFLDLIRSMAGISLRADVESRNNFPTGAGIASSAAAFSALALASSTAAGLKLDEPSLTRLARKGSGSASRSIPDGFVEWLPGTGDEDSYAFSIAPAGHWDLVDVIAVVAAGEKKVGSTEGHGTASTSPLQTARVADAPRRLDLCREAVRTRDFDALAAVMELDSDMMHAVMMTSRPPLFYWEPISLRIIKEVPRWRSTGLPCAYTLDAGPNVHILCPAAATDAVAAHLEDLGGISQILRAAAGGPAQLVL
ncbi:MAG: diphosphomevalonate decarboxylase [Leptolinea sp.]|jgi:diphosphomevalonate decarboxylase|nr:diphosphomevalonate decarboxylase [Leptolinea sp.]